MIKIFKSCRTSQLKPLRDKLSNWSMSTELALRVVCFHSHSFMQCESALQKVSTTISFKRSFNLALQKLIAGTWLVNFPPYLIGSHKVILLALQSSVLTPFHLISQLSILPNWKSPSDLSHTPACNTLYIHALTMRMHNSYPTERPLHVVWVT